MLFDANNRPRQTTHVAFCGNRDRDDEDQLAAYRGVSRSYALRCLVLRAAEPDKLSEASFFFGSMSFIRSDC
jgi:hypothetical protein